MNEKRRAAKFLISAELLHDLMHLPKTAEIIGVDWDFSRLGIWIYLESPDLKPIGLGEEIPVIHPNVDSILRWDLDHDPR